MSIIKVCFKALGFQGCREYRESGFRVALVWGFKVLGSLGIGRSGAYCSGKTTFFHAKTSDVLF